MILTYGSDGLVDNRNGQWAAMIHGYASDIAQKGLLLIPDYFLRTRTSPGDSDCEHGGAAQIQLHRDECGRPRWPTPSTMPRRWTALMRLELPSWDFLLAATFACSLRKEARVLVEFSAPVLDGLGPSVSLKLEDQIHHGKADSLVAFDAKAAKIAQELRTSGALITLYSYEHGEHGFVGEDSANQKARAESKERCLNLLETYLRASEQQIRPASEEIPIRWGTTLS